ncbi:MAG TPA: ABC transporter permease [Candidatus Angelobacter sp.]|nr:ABC transporter permease [Candidatus Angelobacter sp.]
MNRAGQRLLDFAPLLLFVAVLAFFGMQSGKFLEPRNLVNIVVQASSTGIVAVGMTFVLLSAGVDLSVGAIMFVAAAIAGKMALAGSPLALALLVMVGVSLIFGAFNAFFITRVRVAAFIVTLATLFIGRGLGLRITETRAMNLPDSFLQLGAAKVLSVPLPAWLFAVVLVVAHLVLTRTPLGRQIFAVGHDVEMAKKAGIRTGRILATVYLISGACAAIAAMVTLGQLGAVSPKFGEQKEFAAITAAILGGTSLFGGRGSVLPGTLLGTVLIQTIENGLVMTNANPYLYSMIISAVIFAAVLLESLRNRALKL